MKKYIGFAVIFFTFCIACTRDYSNSPKAQLKLINGSINAPKVELYGDGALLTTDVAYPEVSNYIFLNPGKPNIKLTATDGPFPGLTIANGSFTMDAYNNYSMIITDSLAKLKVSFVKDDIATAPDGKSSIRFFHLAQNTGTVNLYFNNIKIDSNRVFNDQGNNANFVKFNNQNSATVNVDVRDSVGNTITTLSNFDFQSTKIYTLVLKGSTLALPNTPQALGISVLRYN